MKKKYYLYLCVAATVLFTFLSCLREPGYAGRSDAFTVTGAQESFEKYATELTVAGLRQGSEEIDVIAMWDYARSFTVNGVQTVEAPMNIIPTYSYESGNADSVTHRIIANTITFLVAQKSRKQKDIDYRVMMFIAEDDYLMDDPLRLSRLSLSSVDDFCGKILYYDIHGKLLDGSVYNDGVLTGVIHPVDRGATRSGVYGGRYRERLIVERVGESRGVNDINWLGEVVITAPCPDPFIPCNCYYTLDSDLGYGGGGGGGGGGSDGGGSTNPPTNPGKPALPAYSKISSNYKDIAKLSPQEVCKKIGGKVLQNFTNDPAYKNTCAIRLSYAFNQSGDKIPYVAGKTSSGDNGDWYFFRVSDMTDYLNNKYGQCIPTNESDLSGKQGIILQTDCGWNDASGHLDVWDGSKAIYQYHSECGKLSYWKF